MPLPLLQLPLGGQARIIAVDAAPDLARLLLESGFLPGSTVSRVAEGLFGGPSAYEVRGLRMALRASEAKAILVVPLP